VSVEAMTAAYVTVGNGYAPDSVPVMLGWSTPATGLACI
jgi:hypothetical protein